MNSFLSDTFADKKVLITGAANGIGRACAIMFSQSGAHVTAVDRDVDALRRLTDDHGIEFIVADLATPEKYFPHDLDIDILINNAGIQHIAPVEEFSMETADLMLGLMLRTPFYLIQKCLPNMYAKGWGRIIGISSIHGHVASPFKSAYVMAKHGMEGLHKTVCLEGGARGVTANTIAPAYVRTQLVEKQIESQAQANNLSSESVVDEIMLAPAAIKRLIEPEEIANMALFLCGPHSNSISGSSFAMDNGWLAR